MSTIEAGRPVLARYAAAILGMLTAASESPAQDIASASHMLPAQSPPDLDHRSQHLSVGCRPLHRMIEGLEIAASAFGVFCSPAQTTTSQRVRAIVTYTEAHPERYCAVYSSQGWRVSPAAGFIALSPGGGDAPTYKASVDPFLSSR
jgi:hypothetical protein